MNIVEESFDHSVFSANRERLLEHDAAAQFFGAVVMNSTRRPCPRFASEDAPVALVRIVCVQCTY